MKPFDYTSSAVTAAAMIGRFGGDVTLSTTTGFGTSAQRTVKAVFVDRVRHVLGDSAVEIGDWRVIMAADAAPLETERLIRGSEEFVLVRVEPIQPAGVVVAWYAWARAG